MNTLLIILGTLATASLQALLPTLCWLGGVRIELLPALVVYGALTLPGRQAFVLAVAAGLGQDALSAAPFGISALAFSAAALVMIFLRDALDRELPWMQIGAGAATSVVSAMVASFVVGISFGMIFKVLLVAAISGVITPVLFFAFDYTGMRWRSA
jgi:rod shape-determining protein MreD